MFFSGGAARGTARGTALARALDALEELAWPTRCVGCNLPGELLCASCRSRLPWIDQRHACPTCGAPHGWLTCTECGRTMRQEVWPTRAVVCSFPFEGVVAAMGPALKDGHELRLAGVMAAAMACSLEEASCWPASDGRARFDATELDALCFVPATARAYARRGFDHMELVSRSLSGLTGIPLDDVLVRVSAKDQRALGRSDRAANLAGTVGVVRDVAGRRMLLADDVITTGASVAEAAGALLAAGAASVTACALARVWR